MQIAKLTPTEDRPLAAERFADLQCLSGEPRMPLVAIRLRAPRGSPQPRPAHQFRLPEPCLTDQQIECETVALDVPFPTLNAVDSVRVLLYFGSLRLPLFTGVRMTVARVSRGNFTAEAEIRLDHHSGCRVWAAGFARNFAQDRVA
jgi:hypothetical protein